MGSAGHDHEWLQDTVGDSKLRGDDGGEEVAEFFEGLDEEVLFGLGGVRVEYWGLGI